MSPSYVRRLRPAARRTARVCGRERERESGADDQGSEEALLMTRLRVSTRLRTGVVELSNGAVRAQNSNTEKLDYCTAGIGLLCQCVALTVTSALAPNAPRTGATALNGTYAIVRATRTCGTESGPTFNAARSKADALRGARGAAAW